MLDMAQLRRIVERHFRVYDARDQAVRGTVMARMFFVMFPPGEFDARYAAAKRDLAAAAPDLLLFLRRDHGEDILMVAERPPAPPRRLGLHLGLFLGTLATTVIAGAVSWQSYWHPAAGWQWSALWDPQNLLWGFLTFSLPLLLILGIHEGAHMMAARRHGLRATLPYFIPAPPLVMPIGTFGAFISMRDPLPDRRALFDVGASGPIAGFLVALPIVILGAFLTTSVAQPVPDIGRPILGADAPYTLEAGPGYATLVFDHPAPGIVTFNMTAPRDDAIGDTWDWTVDATVETQQGSDTGTRHDSASGHLHAGAAQRRSLTIPANATTARIHVTWDNHLVSFGDSLLVLALNQAFPDNGRYLTHPLFFAGWVGLLLAGINLLPSGQLDGGHVARAVVGDRYQLVSRAAFILLILLSIVYLSWLLFAMFILMTGTGHQPPLNDVTKLDRRRQVLAWCVLAIFLLTFVPIPLSI